MEFGWYEFGWEWQPAVEKISIFLNSGQGINYQEIQFDLWKFFIVITNY
jgi:hypothetical protein